jgi:dUTP pyrophosphatase
MKYTDYSPHWAKVPLKYFKLTPEAFAPEWSTEHAACFDLRACLLPVTVVKAYTETNIEFTKVTTDGPNTVILNPGERVMIPTGLIFDIPLGYSVRLHPRSGLSLKQGLVLANQEGVIDSDYVHPTYLVIKNTSKVCVTITHGDRIAQGEMIPDISYDVQETPDKPQDKTDRKGGFGSTGVK